jgi:hypothetical protein
VCLSFAQSQTTEGSKYSMPSKLHAWIAQPQLRKWASTVQLFFPLMFTFGEMLSHVPPVPQDDIVMPPPLRNASLPCVATVYNKLTGGGGCWCVSITASSLPGCTFTHVLSSVCCLFWYLPSPSVMCLRQAHPVCESWHSNRDLRGR